MSFGQCNIRCDRAGFVVEADFSIPDKGVLGIFGHSGSGKTTLLRCLAGLEKNVQGSININGTTWQNETKSITSQQRNISYIFQEGRLFPHLTVKKNLEYGSSRSLVKDKSGGGNNSALNWEQVTELLNISHLLARYPHQLSGGEKQRVAIGRALLKKPQMLLLDEPLASLDVTHKREILSYLEILHEELSIPMLYVSHDLGEMLRLCDYMLVMEQGRSVFSGVLQDALVLQQSPLTTVESSAVVLEGSVSKQEKDFDISTIHTVNGNQFQVPGLIPIGKRVRLIISASDVSVAKNKATQSSILNIIKGQVSAVLDKKDGRILVQVNCNQDIILTLISIKSFQLLQLAVGTDVYIQVKAVVTRGN